MTLLENIHMSSTDYHHHLINFLFHFSQVKFVTSTVVATIFYINHWRFSSNMSVKVAFWSEL